MQRNCAIFNLKTSEVKLKHRTLWMKLCCRQVAWYFNTPTKRQIPYHELLKTLWVHFVLMQYIGKQDRGGYYIPAVLKLAEWKSNSVSTWQDVTSAADQEDKRSPRALGTWCYLRVPVAKLSQSTWCYLWVPGVTLRYLVLPQNSWGSLLWKNSLWWELLCFDHHTLLSSSCISSSIDQMGKKFAK